MGLETKTDLKQETIDGLQELIQINVDSADGFRHAAEKVDNSEYSRAFREIAQRRERQADELSTYVSYNREEPNREGSYAASFHRTWLSVREALSSNNLHTVLSEAERGEDAIKEAYEDVLKKTAGSAMNDVLTEHYQSVKADHDAIRDLRDATK